MLYLWIGLGLELGMDKKSIHIHFQRLITVNEMKRKKYFADYFRSLGRRITWHLLSEDDK